MCLLVLQDALEEYAAQPFCVTNHGSTLAVTSQWIKQLEARHSIPLAVQQIPLSFCSEAWRWGWEAARGRGGVLNDVKLMNCHMILLVIWNLLKCNDTASSS